MATIILRVMTFVVVLVLLLCSCDKAQSPVQPSEAPPVAPTSQPPEPSWPTVELDSTDPPTGSTLRGMVEDREGYLVGDFLKVYLRFTLPQELIDEAKKSGEKIVLIAHLSVDGETALVGALFVRGTEEVPSGRTEHKLALLRSVPAVKEVNQTNFILYRMEFRKDNRPRDGEPIATGRFAANFRWK